MNKLMIPALLLAALPAFTQNQSYAGHQARELKSLSVDEVKHYLSGAGGGQGHGMKH